MAGQAAVSRRAQRAIHERHRRRARIVAALAAVVIAGAVVGLVLLSGGGGDDDTATVDVDMFEFGFDGDLTAPAGAIRISATNTGEIAHNIGIRRGPISGDVQPGAGVDLDLGELAPGSYELYCDIVGHADAGMVAPLVVTEPEPTPQT